MRFCDNSIFNAITSMNQKVKFEICELIIHNISYSYIHIVLNQVATVTSINNTIDNNLGPDRLAGPKDLDPNFWRQPTL